jgi:hypothetical protein
MLLNCLKNLPPLSGFRPTQAQSEDKSVSPIPSLMHNSWHQTVCALGDSCKRKRTSRLLNFFFLSCVLFIFFWFLVFFFWKMGPPSRDVRLLCEVHSHVRGCCVVVVMV